MGATHVTVAIRNPADPEKCWEGLFLVDTGATDSVAPRDHLEAIGLNPKSQRIWHGADSWRHGPRIGRYRGRPAQPDPQTITCRSAEKAASEVPWSLARQIAPLFAPRLFTANSVRLRTWGSLRCASPFCGLRREKSHGAAIL